MSKTLASIFLGNFNPADPKLDVVVQRVNVRPLEGPAEDERTLSARDDFFLSSAAPMDVQVLGVESARGLSVVTLVDLEQQHLDSDEESQPDAADEWLSRRAG